MDRMSFLPTFWPPCLTVSSPFSTWPLSQSLASVTRSILLMLSPVSTGLSTSGSNWQSLHTKLFTALHLSTYQASCSTLLICRRYVKAGCARLPPDERSRLLDVRPSRLVTVGDRLFAAAGPQLWNSLPVDIQSAPSLTAFCQKLKTFIPAIIPKHCF